MKNVEIGTISNVKVEGRLDLLITATPARLNVVVSSPFEDYVDMQVTVMDKDLLVEYYNAIDKDKLAKTLVELAWDMKDSDVFLAMELSGYSYRVDCTIREIGVDYAYPALHQEIMHTSAKLVGEYDTLEEALINYKTLVDIYDYEYVMNNIDELYEEIIEE